MQLLEPSTLVEVPPDVSRLLASLRAGDESALSELVTLLYNELHRIASRYLRSERGGHTLQTTALVHEVYLKMLGDRQPAFADRAHFLAVASRTTRQVLVDYARNRARKKRGGDDGLWQKITLTTNMHPKNPSGIDPAELLDLNGALEALAAEDELLAKVVEMHYFGGMTAEETAAVLGQSVHVVRNDLRLAQSWLRRKLNRQR